MGCKAEVTDGMAATVTTIAVTKQTKNTLQRMGHKGETYDEIINRAVKFAQRQLFYDRQYKILKEDEFIGLQEL